MKFMRSFFRKWRHFLSSIKARSWRKKSTWLRFLFSSIESQVMKSFISFVITKKIIWRFLSICWNPKDDSGKNVVSPFRGTMAFMYFLRTQERITNSTNSVQYFEKSKGNVKVYPPTTLLRKVQWRKFHKTK